MEIDYFKTESNKQIDEFEEQDLSLKHKLSSTKDFCSGFSSTIIESDFQDECSKKSLNPNLSEKNLLQNKKRLPLIKLNSFIRYRLIHSIEDFEKILNQKQEKLVLEMETNIYFSNLNDSIKSSKEEIQFYKYFKELISYNKINELLYSKNGIESLVKFLKQNYIDFFFEKILYYNTYYPTFLCNKLAKVKDRSIKINFILNYYLNNRFSVINNLNYIYSNEELFEDLKLRTFPDDFKDYYDSVINYYEQLKFMANFKKAKLKKMDLPIKEVYVNTISNISFSEMEMTLCSRLKGSFTSLNMEDFSLNNN